MTLYCVKITKLLKQRPQLRCPHLEVDRDR